MSAEHAPALDACVRQAGAERTFPFGPHVTVFKIAGKIFAFFELERTPARVTLKCEPEHGELLRDEHAAIAAGYHMDKRHWITLTLDGSLPPALIEELIEDSYDLVAPRRFPQGLTAEIAEGRERPA